MEDYTKVVWQQLWRSIDHRRNGDWDSCFEDLQKRYAEPQRHYHIWQHIKQCLVEWESVRYVVINPEAIAAAIFYHDAVYDPKASGNEALSAELFAKDARRAHLTDFFIWKVTRLILATKHIEIPSEEDAHFMIDIDLSILGQEETYFDEYERQIRQEYVYVPSVSFAMGRSGILNRFRAHEYIYLTPYFRRKYEESARRNIDRSLERLASMM